MKDNDGANYSFSYSSTSKPAPMVSQAEQSEAQLGRIEAHIEKQDEALNKLAPEKLEALLNSGKIEKYQENFQKHSDALIDSALEGKPLTKEKADAVIKDLTIPELSSAKNPMHFRDMASAQNNSAERSV